jgi:WD40 repeat protein
MYDCLGFAAEKGVFFSVDISQDLYGGPGARIPKDCMISFMKMPGGKELLQLRWSAISAMATSQSRRLLATVGYETDTYVYLWDIVKYKQIGRLPRQDKGRPIMAFGFDDRILACAENNNAVIFWNLEKKQVIGELVSKEHHNASNPIMSMVFSRSGDLLITGTRNGSVYFWDVKDYLKERAGR